MYAVQAGDGHEKPPASPYVVSRRICAVGIHHRELTLSAGQALFGGSQQPLDGFRSVALYGIPVVVEATIVNDSKIELRGSIPVLGSYDEVLYRVGL